MNAPSKTPQFPGSNWEEFLELLGDQRFNAAQKICLNPNRDDPKDPRWALGNAWCQMGTGRLHEALALAQQAAEAGASGAVVFRTIAMIYLRMGRIEPAHDAARHAFRLEPDRASRQLIARIREQLRNVDDDKTAIGKPSETKERPKLARLDDSTGLTTGEPDSNDFSDLTGQYTSQSLTRTNRRRKIGEASPNNAQLQALYGASIFGKWQALVDASAVPGWTRFMKPLPSWQKTVLWSVAVLLSIMMAGAVKLILDRSARRETTLLSGRIEHFMRVGALQQLADLLETDSASHDAFVSPTGKLFDAMNRAQATLYRYHDADERRLVRLRSSPDQPLEEASFDEVITRSLVLSEVERIALLPHLWRIENAQTGPRNARDPESGFLISSALRRGDAPIGARKALDGALLLEPTNLVIMTALIWDQTLLRHHRKADELVAQAMEINPASAWARLGQERVTVWFGGKHGDESAPTLDDPEPLEGVPLAELNMLDALDQLRHNDTEQAEFMIVAAARSVNAEPPFLIDFSEQILKSKHPTLARRLFAFDTWPRDNLAAMAIEARVALAEGKRKIALNGLTAVWQQGFRDPRVAEALATLLRPNSELTVSQLLTDVIEILPQRIDLEVQVAEALLNEGKPGEASNRLAPRIDAIRSQGGRRLGGEAVALLAESEAAQGKTEEAIKRAYQATQIDRKNTRARDLLKRLVPTPPPKPSKKRVRQRGRGHR